MDLLTQTTQQDLQAQIAITGPKSETNRLFSLQALFPNLF
jgi:3-phosphoshikimate 1-carboxyvinyltransferase